MKAHRKRWRQQQTFAKIKSHLRAKAVRSLDMIIQELGEALKTFSSKTCSNLFRHANYASM